MFSKVDISKEKFGRLTAISLTESYKVGVMMLLKNKNRKLYDVLIKNGFKKSDCTQDRLRTLWQEDLQLNRYKLEVASQEQSVVFEKWATLCEDLSGLVEDENAVLRRMRSRLDLKIRSCPKRVLEVKYGISDLKESAIKSLIELDQKIRKQEKKIQFLKLFYMKIKVVVKASEQRKSSLRVLTDLYINNYFNVSAIKGKYFEKRRK